MDTLLSMFTKRDPVKVVGYADDILLYVNGSDSQVMRELLQKALNKVQTWGLEHGLEFSPVKTTAVMFERSRKKVNEPTLTMGVKTLNYSKELRYLGITIAKRLTWTAHVERKIKQCNYLLHKSRNVVGREWGLSPAKVLWIPTAIIHPRISYGAMVWAHSICKTTEVKIERIQRRSVAYTHHELSAIDSDEGPGGSNRHPSA